MAALSSKRKISKLTDDIAAMENTIKENTRKLAELKEEKQQTENTEIISIVRKAGLSLTDIEELIRSDSVRVLPKPKTEDTSADLPMSRLQNERKI